MAVAEFILHPPDVFLFNDTATTEIYTLSLHDALPISPQILLGLSDVERHEELAGPVGLVGRLAVVHVGRQRGEALGGEAVTDVLDVLYESPPLLDHEHARALARRGRCEVTGGLAAVRGKLHHLASHEGLLRS